MTVRERNGKFQAQVRIKQGGVIVHAETETFSTRKLAEDWKARVTKRIKEQGVSARVRDLTTFSDLLDKYQAERDKFKPLSRSIVADLDLLRRDLGTVRLADLNVETFTKFARKRRGPDTGPATVMHNLATARSVLNAAKPMFGIDVSGAPVTEALKSLQLMGVVSRSNKRDRRPTPAEVAALLADFDRIWLYPSSKIPMSKIVQIAVAFPRRLGELCSMLWADYDGKTVVLRDTKHPRFPRTETVPVPPAAAQLIDTLPKLDERILPYKSESISASFDRACERLKIVDLHFHDLRHDGISQLFEKGMDIPSVAMISGHMSWSNLKRYTHLSPKDVLEKLNAGQ